MTNFRCIVISTVILLLGNKCISQTRYVDKVFDSVSKETFRYSKINDTILNLDIYEPVKDTLSKRPLILIVHGGGFNTGKRDDASIQVLAKNVAQKGYVVASVDYRLLFF